METVVSLLIITGFLYVIFLQIDAYNHLKVADFRFRLFAIRDDLALLVCKGEIKESSWEYRYIIDALNYHISAVETLSIVELVEAIAKFHTSHDEERAVQRFGKQVNRKDIRTILDRYTRTVREIIIRNSEWQIRFINVAALIIRKLQLQPSQQARDTVQNPKLAIRAIDAHRSAFHLDPLNNFSHGPQTV